MTGTAEEQTREQQRITINPYIRPKVNASQYNNSLNTMPQSQWRKSSILHCKQKASLFRGPRTYNPYVGSSNRACRVCKVKEHNKLIEKQIQDAKMAKASIENIKKLQSNLKNIPHRAHIRNCPGNNTRKKQLALTVPNMNEEPTPLAGTTTNTITRPMLSFQQRTWAVDLVHRERWKATPLATELRMVLQAKLQDSDYMAKLKACRAPPAIAVLVDFIDSTFLCRRPKDQNLPASENFVEKYDQYRRFFQAGSIAFVFPSERRDCSPFPHYHAVEGTTYLHVDWSMSHPEVKLCCVQPGCQGVLKRERLAFQKNRTLLPILQQQNHCLWANVMKYVCDICEETCYANDGRLLSTLPIEVARCYPVKPRYAGASDNDRNFFQLSVELSEDLEDNILTYANAAVFSRKIWKRVLREYERRLLDYYSIAKSTGCLLGPYVSLFQFSGKFYAPSGDQLYNMYHSAERSKLTITGVSEYDRHRREMIGIGCDGLTAIDWTFSVCKNYNLREKGAATCFTMNNDAGQVAAAFLVQSTRVGEIAHGVRQVSLRPTFQPKVVATDTWPAKKEFWLRVFTSATTGMLGLFHFMKRIVDTLRITNSKFHHALRDLKECIYDHNTEDYGKLVEVLQNGTMSHAAEPMTHLQIEELKKTSRWNQRYSRFLRKDLHLPASIKQSLLCWVDKYKECKDPLTDQHLFVGTARVVDRQIMHLHDIQCPKDVEMYVKIPPGPRATHGLNSFRSRNPEPQLESFHAQFANYGNNRMSDDIGDDLHLRGIVARNLKIQHIIDVREGRIDVDPLPAHLVDIPLLQDHHFGLFVNNLAVATGCPVQGLPFKYLKPLPDDTGERFLAEYFHAQKERNQNDATKPDIATDFCRCCQAQATNIHNLTVVQPVAKEVPHCFFPVLPKVPIALDNERVYCCDRYKKYHQHKVKTGRFKPGRIPHASDCPDKTDRQKVLKGGVDG
jgi:hypothetical protein